VGHKIPAKRLLTFKRDEDLTFMVKYDGELPPTVPVTIAKYNITGVKKAMVCVACFVYGHASVRCVCARGRARKHAM
jgi:nitrate reductase cytochrome c-type subunit